MIEEKQPDFSDKKKHILDVAEQLFALNGFAGTSVRDIALEAGVNIAMISYYFGSKEKLLEAVFEYKSAYIKNQLEQMINDSSMEPIDKVYSLVDHLVEKVMTQQNFHKIMVREQIASKDSSIRALIHETKKRNQELIKKIINEGQKKGAFKRSIDIPLMMMTMIGTVNQMLTTQSFYKEMNNLEGLSEEEFQKHIKKKMTQHLKSLFKAILTYE